MIGSDRVSAFLKSSLKALSSALAELASPTSSMRSCGWARCAAATVLSTGTTRFFDCSLSPRIWKITSAERSLGASWPLCPGWYGPVSSVT